MVELVQELIDAIVDEVAATDQWFECRDRQSLRACAMAARTFLGPSQRRLFESLTLYGGRRLKGVANAFTASPHLASYVRDLKLDVYFDDDIRRHSHLATIFALLSGVRRLVISFRGEPWWDSFSDDVRAAFCSMLALPSLRCFGMTNCTHVPPSLISHALLTYEEVALIAIELDNANPVMPLPPRDEGRPTMTLNHLAIQSSQNPEALRTLIDEMAVSLQYVRYMEICLRRSGTLDELEEVALKCLNSLQHLVIDFSKLHDDSVDLPNIPNLSFLTLKASVRKFRIPYGLQAVMVTLPTRMPHLEVVTVIIEADFEVYRESFCDPKVEEALKNLPRLRDVHFSISSWSVSKDWFNKGVAQILPKASFSKCNTERRYHPMVRFSN